MSSLERLSDDTFMVSIGRKKTTEMRERYLTPPFFLIYANIIKVNNILIFMLENSNECFSRVRD